MSDALTTVCAWCGRTLDSSGASGGEGDAGWESHGPGSESHGPRPESDARGSESDAPGSESHAPGRVSHGICPDCVRSLDMGPVADLHELTRDEYDQLPFGVIRVDPEGVVTAYNAWEERLTTFSRERVVGLNFFRDVAPCTAVREFEGRYREMVGRGRPDRRELSFVFTLAGGDRRVHIVLVWHPTFDEGLILVQDKGPDRGSGQGTEGVEGSGPT